MPFIPIADSVESAAKDSDPKNVHKLRTTIRRCEGVIASSAYDAKKKEADALQRLKKVRKAAGAVRDIDIHLGLLEHPIFTQAVMNGAPALLASALKTARKQTERKLKRRLDKAIEENAADKAEKISKKAARRLPPDLAAAAAREIQTIAQSADLNDAPGLHEVRIALKKIRYALEVSDDEAYKDLITELKTVHDAIGEWHDWVTLAEVAETHLKKRAPLVIEARRRAASLFVTALEKTSAFFAPYQIPKKKPAAVTTASSAARARA